jgi:hypothetical protein
MPRHELLTPTERVQLFAFTYIRQHRDDHNRLGLAIQMVY